MSYFAENETTILGPIFSSIPICGSEIGVTSPRIDRGIGYPTSARRPGRSVGPAKLAQGSSSALWEKEANSSHLSLSNIALRPGKEKRLAVGSDPFSPQNRGGENHPGTILILSFEAVRFEILRTLTRR